MGNKNIDCGKITLDMFGKKISLFFNGNETDGTTFGKMMTFIYIGLYIILFLVTTITVLLKNGGNYYDSELTPTKLPEIKLNHDLLYFGFSLQNAKTYDSYLDESIYYPKAYYKQAKRENNIWKWEIEEIEIEKCKLEKFGKNYQNLFSNKPLNNLYCFKNINHILKGHYIYDEYSLYSISIFPCVNKTENNYSCKSKEEIENKIENSLFSVEMESIGLNPNNHSYPAQPIAENLYTSIGTEFIREFHIFLEIVQIQTDENLIFENFKKENFLRYSKNTPMLSIKKNIMKEGNSVCDFELKLSDKIKVQKRSYTKIYSSLSNTGGAMVFIRVLIVLFSFLPVQTLHELNVINKLFKIDKSKKALALNNLKKFKVLALQHTINSSFVSKNNDGSEGNKIILSSRLRNNLTNINRRMLNIITKNTQQTVQNNEIISKISDSNNDSNFLSKSKNNFSRFYKKSPKITYDSFPTVNFEVKKNETYKNNNSTLHLIPEHNNINIISKINHIDISKIIDNGENSCKSKHIKTDELKIDSVSDFSPQKDKTDEINNFSFVNHQKRYSLNNSFQVNKKNNSEKMIFTLKSRFSLHNAYKNNGKENKLKLTYLETYFVRVCKGKMKSKNILLFEEITDCYRKYLDVIKIFRNQVVFDRLIENNINIEKLQKLDLLNNRPRKKSKTISPKKISKNFY